MAININFKISKLEYATILEDKASIILKILYNNWTGTENGVPILK